MQNQQSMYVSQNKNVSQIDYNILSVDNLLETLSCTSSYDYQNVSRETFLVYRNYVYETEF